MAKGIGIKVRGNKNPFKLAEKRRKFIIKR